MYRRTLVLTPAQRAELEQTRDHDPRAYLREIAAGLLKVADGQAAFAVAAQGLHKRRKPDTVYRWLTKYAQGGLPALVHRPRGHRGHSPRGGRAAARAGPAAPGTVRRGPQPLAAG